MLENILKKGKKAWSVAKQFIAPAILSVALHSPIVVPTIPSSLQPQETQRVARGNPLSYLLEVPEDSNQLALQRKKFVDYIHDDIKDGKLDSLSYGEFVMGADHIKTNELRFKESREPIPLERSLDIYEKTRETAAKEIKRDNPFIRADELHDFLVENVWGEYKAGKYVSMVVTAETGEYNCFSSTSLEIALNHDLAHPNAELVIYSTHGLTGIVNGEDIFLYEQNNSQVVKVRDSTEEDTLGEIYLGNGFKVVERKDTKNLGVVTPIEFDVATFARSYGKRVEDLPEAIQKYFRIGISEEVAEETKEKEESVNWSGGFGDKFAFDMYGIEPIPEEPPAPTDNMEKLRESIDKALLLKNGSGERGERVKFSTDPIEYKEPQIRATRPGDIGYFWLWTQQEQDLPTEVREALKDESLYKLAYQTERPIPVGLINLISNLSGRGIEGFDGGGVVSAKDVPREKVVLATLKGRYAAANFGSIIRSPLADKDSFDGRLRKAFKDIREQGVKSIMGVVDDVMYNRQSLHIGGSTYLEKGKVGVREYVESLPEEMKRPFLYAVIQDWKVYPVFDSGKRFLGEEYKLLAEMDHCEDVRREGYELMDGLFWAKEINVDRMKPVMGEIDDALYQCGVSTDEVVKIYDSMRKYCEGYECTEVQSQGIKLMEAIMDSRIFKGHRRSK